MIMKVKKSEQKNFQKFKENKLTILNEILGSDSQGGEHNKNIFFKENVLNDSLSIKNKNSKMQKNFNKK